MSGFNGIDRPTEDRKYYFGIGKYKVICVNPSKKEMIEKLGYKEDNTEEPNYTGTSQDGQRQARITIHVEHVDTKMRQRADYYIVDVPKSSSGGKLQYCNSKGKFSYLDDPNNIPANMAWFDNTGIRPAFKGEEALIDFIFNLFDIQPKKTPNFSCQIANVEALFKGDFSEIKAILNDRPEKSINLLAGIKSYDKDGETKFTTVIYNRKTGRGWSKDNQLLINDVVNYKANGGATSIYYGDGEYKFTGVEDPTSLPFFQSDNPSELATTTQEKAF